MSSYAKFLKEILSNKRKLEDYETITLIEKCSAILQNKLSPKLKDPEGFSIPYLISNMNIDKALCDLGASMSLMPLSTCQKLNVGELRPTTISLQLANRRRYSDTHYIGKAFFGNRQSYHRRKNGQLTLKVGEKEVELNLFRAMKYKFDPNEYLTVNIIDKLIEEEF
ncbi:uncharacterized protein LOC110653584 [Hevea brasiliensis]|uniref:uncharacterized protein LOC110653584 n=1 Tax=Hevea brasiliensis TaxID=3981 RepID=UPI0025F56C83|nr:uncharacterized protein LOC110653584 [Hevea brasiliensis]